MSDRWGTHRDAAPPAVRQAVLTRDGHQCTYIEDGARCTARATDVHHPHAHVDGGNDTEENLVSLCAHHHRRITGREAARHRWPTTTRRPSRKHPGMI